MDTYKGIGYLRRKLERKKSRVEKRYKYYEMKNIVRDFNISTPPDMRYWMGTLGWCAKAVDALADRLVFDRFENDIFDLNTIYNMNNKQVLTDSAFLGALISSCDFIYISEGEDGFPRLRTIDGQHATGIIDPLTNMLKEGYAVLEFDEHDKPILEAYFITGNTLIYEKGRLVDAIENVAPYPLLVPVIHRPDATRPFGHSRISRACMSIMSSAVRTVKRSEIAAEFFAYPQKYVLGLDESTEDIDAWRASMSSMLRFDKDENGDRPTVGQFQQQSQTPHNEQLKMFAGLFAGETGLTVDDLGFPSDNPSISEAIKASHENLRLAARAAQRNFGDALLNAGYLAACVRDNYPYLRRQLYNTIPKFAPIFEPDMSAMSGLGDAIGKINQAVPGFFTANNLRDYLGFSSDLTTESAVFEETAGTETEE